jgi:hypothetical protein
MKALQKLVIILVVNAIIILSFVSSSQAIANEFNNHPSDLLHVHWNFFGLINIVHEGYLVNGNYYGIGTYDLFYDFPFWLFFFSTAINLLFIIMLLIPKERKQKQT